MQTPTDDVNIREYVDGDESAVIALARELQAHEHARYQRMKPSAEIGQWYVEDLKQQCAQNDGQILVLEYQGKVAGYATVLMSITQDAIDEVDYTFARVGDIVITGSRRGLGLGKMLMKSCEQRARTAGAKWLRIEVLAHNNEAIKLYRTSGFKDHLIELEKPLVKE